MCVSVYCVCECVTVCVGVALEPSFLEDVQFSFVMC